VAVASVRWRRCLEDKTVDLVFAFIRVRAHIGEILELGNRATYSDFGEHFKLSYDEDCAQPGHK
jgi:hypothetical protein